MKAYLIGLGAGPTEGRTAQAETALQEARLFVGASRLLDCLPETLVGARVAAVDPKKVLEALEAGGAETAAVLLSGDSGFYSGARRLLPLLEERGIEVELLPGLSCVQLLAAYLKAPWQDWQLVSAHGVDCDPVAEVLCGRETFFLTGGTNTPAALCARLARAGLGELPVTVGEELGLPGEKISRGTAEEMAEGEFAPLSVLLTGKAPLGPRRTPGWPDEWFLRDQTPMTKRMVRACALSLLGVTREDVCWDVGAGTGSVSVELAALCRSVWAVERDEEAFKLLMRNRERFCAWNLQTVKGHAPEALEDLPAPDAAFIGGSGGELPAIVEAVLSKNPAARLCISAISLETLELARRALRDRGIEPTVTQVAVSRDRAAGGLHLLLANNPVFLIAGNCP